MVSSYASYKASDSIIENKENDEVIREVVEQLKKCIKYKLEEPLNSFNWNKNNFKEKTAKDVLKSIKSLRENIPIRKNSNLMNTFSD